MKNRLLLLGGLVILLFASCSEDFNVAAPYKHITFVYGLLSTGDTAHYIRIEKAFLDESHSAIDMAKIADSSYYDTNQIKVYLKEVSPSGTVLQTMQMPRVNLVDEGYVKDSGVFFTSPYYAYKSKWTLNEDNTYRLVIVNNTNNTVDSGETDVITNNSTVVPGFKTFYVNGFNDPTQTLTLTYSNPTTELTFTVHVPEHAAYMEGVLRFHFVNKNTVTNVQTDDSVDLSFPSQVVSQGTPKLKIPISSIYTFLAAAIGPPPAGVERYMDSCDVFVNLAGPDYLSYLTYANSLGGITGEQIKPIFTNIRGQDVYGLLNTRAQRVRYNLGLNQNSIDSLRSSAITGMLNIKGRSDH